MRAEAVSTFERDNAIVRLRSRASRTASSMVIDRGGGSPGRCAQRNVVETKKSAANVQDATKNRARFMMCGPYAAHRTDVAPRREMVKDWTTISEVTRTILIWRNPRSKQRRVSSSYHRFTASYTNEAHASALRCDSRSTARYSSPHAAPHSVLEYALRILDKCYWRWHGSTRCVLC